MLHYHDWLRLIRRLLLLRPGGCEVLWWVCLSACLFSHISQNHTHEPRQIFYSCWLASPWLGSRLSALRYVMYFRFCRWGHVLHGGPSCEFLSGDRRRQIYNNRRDSNQILFNDKDRKNSLWVALNAKSTIYDCLVYFYYYSAGKLSVISLSTAELT